MAQKVFFNFVSCGALLILFLHVISISHVTIAASFGDNCNNSSDCTEINQKCMDQQCNCSKGYILENTTCREPTNGEACIADVNCTKTLLCLSGNCQCNTATQYFNSSIGDCSDRKGFDQACSNTNTTECKDTLTCLDQVCNCTQDRYRNGVQCSPRKGFDQPCSDTNPAECKDTLTCLNQVCNCTQDQYRNGDQCSPRKGYDEACSDTTECKDTLTCLGSFCKCTQDQYRNGDQCSPRPDHGESCDSQVVPCKEGFICKNAGKCLCPDTQFYRPSDKCEYLTTLIVNNVTVETGTDTANFTWTDPSQGMDSLSYIIQFEAVDPPNSTLQREKAHSTGGNLSGLTPGTQYSFTVITIIASDVNYAEREVPAPIILRWMKPSKPGELLQITADQLIFNASFGVVDSYSATLKTGDDAPLHSDGVVDNDKVGFTFQDLTPATEYTYTITAYNKNSDPSEPRQGNLTTNSAPSGIVRNLAVIPAKSSANITWNAPTEPNGIITGYNIYLLDTSGTCIQHGAIGGCSNCSTSRDCKSTFKNYNGDSSSYNLSVYLEELMPSHNYIVFVVAFNEEGGGTPSNVSFLTEVAAAEPVTGVMLTPLPLNEGRVGLMVNWTTESFTGPTNFTVTVSSETTLNSMEYELFTREILEGFNTTRYVVDDSLAYWQYEAQVQAFTSAGSSKKVSSNTVRTFPNRPGVIEGLTIMQSPDVASELSLEFNCPEEKERNGSIEGFYIMRTPQNSNEAKILFKAKKTCLVEVTITDMVEFGPLIVGENYSFAVMVKNHEYNGSYSDSVNHYVAPKAPSLAEYDSRSFIHSSSTQVPSETYVTVEVCNSCLQKISQKQGKLTAVSLIVCTKSSTSSCLSPLGRKKRSTIFLGDLNGFPTWAQARESAFSGPYRATPSNWHETILADTNSNYLFPVGGDSSCSTSDTNSYCNGPLPSGREFIITVVACNAAGCVSYTRDDEVFITKATESSDDAGLIAGVVVGVIVLLAVVAVVTFFVLRRRNHNKHMGHARRMNPDGIEQTGVPKRERPILIRTFKETVEKLHKDANLLFQDDFEDIKMMSAKFGHTTNEAMKMCNRVKNRFVDILPYDHTRVKLSSQHEDEEPTDFINANYIEGYNSRREYIAAQGPLHGTVPHFWRMIWEQKTRVIVMLSDLYENGREKVALYWPENLNEPINYDDVIVEMTNFSQLNKYIIRNFKITCGNESRKLTHFFLPGWSDFSANLTVEDVLEFAKLVRQEARSANFGPITVHCSAGVGRTGTFIALDYFIQYVENHSLEDELDIFSFVLKMRQNRPRMVQAETQYIFIFDALNEVIRRKIKAEEERLYDNVGQKNVYSNDRSAEDHVYANSAHIKEKPEVNFSYENKAFEPETEFCSVDLSDDMKDTPTTAL